MNIPAPTVLIPRQTNIEDQIASLPNCAGVYSLLLSGAEPHIVWSANLPRRLKRLLVASASPDQQARTRLRERVAAVECWATGSKLEASLLLYELMKRLFPGDYLRRLRLRLPWFVSLVAEDGYGRLSVGNRMGRDLSQAWGPFATRELAQYYQEEVLELFQMRRCTERLHPSPEHPGCIYGEMRQCLRPCQGAVTAQEYGAESERVAEFMRTNGRSAVLELAGAREQASAALQFEEAQQLHKRMERAQAAIAARGDLVAEVAHLNGIALTRSTQPQQVYLWGMLEGRWQNAVTLDLPQDQAQAKSLDSQLREKLTPVVTGAAGEGNCPEHLALLLRWQRASSRDGEWFPFRTPADISYRKLVRGISKMIKADL